MEAQERTLLLRVDPLLAVLYAHDLRGLRLVSPLL